MEAYEGTYKVVNKEWHTSLPEMFDTFEQAYKAMNKWDKGASIEQVLGDTVDVVWQPEFAMFMSNVNF